MHKSAIGARLKEERERLGMSQTQFAGLGEASKRAQINYEQGDSTPDASYLAAVSRVGVDVLYVVTGMRSSALMGKEALLLEGFRKMDEATKERTLAMVYSGTPPTSSYMFDNTGANITNQMGTNTAPITIDMRKSKK